MLTNFFINYFAAGKNGKIYAGKYLKSRRAKDR